MSLKAKMTPEEKKHLLSANVEKTVHLLPHDHLDTSNPKEEKESKPKNTKDYPILRLLLLILLVGLLLIFLFFLILFYRFLYTPLPATAVMTETEYPAWEWAETTSGWSNCTEIHPDNQIHVDNHYDLETRQTTIYKSPPPTDKAFINTALTKANAVRTKYKAPALKWNATLASVALKKSNACKVNHTGPYGENVYWTWFTPADYKLNFTTYTIKANDAWVSQREIDAYKSGDLLGGGHFTQSVWKATKEIGCAWSTTRCTQNAKQEWFFTCDYYPRGNISPYYAGNVTVV